ncbi:hypothetical protein GUJ93_ZPchr0007g4862 [Zizania palustris]|uniref:Uncharacterized protein n=1 Tax=Zizania palustris TaxID=103762 RepID=A0A8J5TDD5_ZIZPA|nr:hypothetical protein GUJ93_ZPchr0007g4862 [Zizania palustris]
MAPYIYAAGGEGKALARDVVERPAWSRLSWAWRRGQKDARIGKGCVWLPFNLKRSIRACKLTGVSRFSSCNCFRNMRFF